MKTDTSPVLKESLKEKLMVHGDIFTPTLGKNGQMVDTSIVGATSPVELSKGNVPLVEACDKCELSS